MKKIIVFASTLLALGGLSSCAEPRPSETPTSFNFDQPSITLEVGQTSNFSYTILPESASNTKVTLTLSSTGKDVVSLNTVNKSLTALGIGSTTLRGSIPNTDLSDSLSIHVVEEIIEVTSINNVRSSYDLTIGDSLSLNPTVLPDNASEKTILYSSSNPSVASVSETGVIKALSVGTCDVRLDTVDGSGVFFITTINVESVANPITNISLSPNEVSNIIPGETVKFNATITPANASVRSLTWLVSNENYGEIDESGLFTAKAPGNVIVTARSQDGSGVEAKASVFINDPKDIKVSEIKLSPDTLHIGVGDTLAPNVTILPEKAYNKTLSWSIGDTSIASVDTNGNVTGLKEGVTTLTARSTDGSNISSSISVSVEAISIRKTHLELDNFYRDPYYAPSHGNQKLLMVPIKLSGSSGTAEWTEARLNQVEEAIYAENPETGMSLVSYYYNASYGKLNITGEVAPVYESRFTRNNLDSNWNNLITMYNEATTWLGQNGINLDDYDSNDDGFIDSIHFIVNAVNVDGNSNMWPHMFQTGNNPGTTTNPLTNTYSLSNLDHLGDAITTIHEQGHIFGLEDYYDYTYSGRDYIGSADMQSNNVMDWNAFSKLSVGWVDPYVFDTSLDSQTFTLYPQSTSGDILLIPTESWNGSMYDEYILIELFAPVGNNAYFWNDWHYSLGDGGVRLYHVDARLGRLVGSSSGWGYDMELIPDPNNSPELAGTGEFLNTNSYNDSDYAQTLYSYASSAMREYEPYHLLHLIQAGGEDTYSTGSNYYDSGRPYLIEDDLFQAGDVFTLSSYSDFFENVTTFNNGDSFPYRIEFNKVSKDSASITVTRI